MLYVDQDPGGLRRTAGLLPLEGERTPANLLPDETTIRMPDLSPDGRWIAYTAAVSGRDEVFAQPFPGPGERIQVSTDGGVEVRWSPEGGEIFYRQGDRMMAVSFAAGPPVRVGRPATLFRGRYATDWAGQGYDVARDGRFLMLKETDSPALREIVVVLDWFTVLRRATAR